MAVSASCYVVNRLITCLVNDGGCVRLSVETKGIGGDGRLTPFDCLMRFFEMSFESWPGSVDFRLVVPFSDVAGNDG